MIVRKYTAADRPQVRQIAIDTAFVGQPASAFMDADEILADGLTLYFTDHEPESLFVSEENGKVVGYITGAVDTRIMDRVFFRRILLVMCRRVLTQGVLLRRKNIVFIWRVILSAFRGEFFAPDFSRDYPSTLHINIAASARKLGAGSRLMSAFLEYLKSAGSTGVRMATMSPGAGPFFERHGFKALFRSRRSYFRHVSGQDYPLAIYGQKIKP